MSYVNLLDLANGKFPDIEEPEPRLLSRTMTGPGVLPDLNADADADGVRIVSSDGPSTVHSERLIVVANHLPIKATQITDEKGKLSWDFTWDENSLHLHIKSGLPNEMAVIFVGQLSASIDPKDEEDVTQILLERFNCILAFLPKEKLEKYYHGFCKQYLWPLLHYMLPFSASYGGRFDRSLWLEYVAANNIFSRKVIEVLNPDHDYVWIHDYHLMVLPTLLRRRFNRVRIGFFLHSPFPSSEIYRTLPVREEILKGLLNADLIGFHTFDYARHFLSCCSRMLGLEYQQKRGYIELECHGRTIGIKIMPSGINVGQMENILRQSSTESKVQELKREFAGKTLLLGLDDLDIFKGVNLKFLAIENMLKLRPGWLGKVVLVQILNHACGKGRNAQETETEIRSSCERINDELGNPEYKPIVLVDRPVSLNERVAYYAVAEAVIVTPIRDVMNLIPYEYVVCRQGIPGQNDPDSPPKSMLVISEFIGCSPSLSGAIRVNPWNVEALSEAMNQSISAGDKGKEMFHEKHYRYVRDHDVAYWSQSYFQDLQRACADHFRKPCWGMGLGFEFRVVALDPKFRKLSTNNIVQAYESACSRAILLDYDGTVKIQSSNNKAPSAGIISIINKLCNDPKNTVFLVSGRGKETLGEWFAPCEIIGIAAEHGYFMRWAADKEWEKCGNNGDGWKIVAEPVMRLYTEATDGSWIEKKESALVWHHQEADQSFGSCQAKELLDHLENVLANEPVEVKSGQYIVEVKPQGVNKGVVAEKIFASIAEKGRLLDFVLCVGDDKSDEDMFVAIGEAIKKGLITNNDSVFACTVGQKPSKAEYYLDDSNEIISMLQLLGDKS